jgi:uroporphyrinogen decarboxylase
MLATLSFEIPDRVSFCDSFWPETASVWRQQGLPEGVSPLDLFNVEWRYLFMDTTFRLPEVTLEETTEHKIVRNADGMTARFLKGHSTTPGFEGWLIKTKADWEHYKPLLTPTRARLSVTGLYAFNDDYQPPAVEWAESWRGYQALRAGDKFLALYLHDSWENLWRKLGPETALLALVENPQWVHEISEAHTRLMLETIQRLWGEGVRPDGVLLIGDFASQQGMLFSPAMYREFVFPYHQQVCRFFRSLGVPVIFHCCGRVTPVIPALIQAGIAALQPLSCKSGLELRRLKEEFGRKLVLMGNVDVRALARGGASLDAEVREKVLCGKAGGGYIFHSDHSIPPDIKFSDYQRVADIVAEAGRYE